MPQSLPEGFIPTMIASALLMLSLVWLIFNHAINPLSFSNQKKRVLSYSIAAGLLIWFAIAYPLSQKGSFLNISFNFLPNIGFLFLPILIGVTILSKSNTFKTIVDAIPQHWLIGVQVMRVMGVSFLYLYSINLMPAEFAIPAGVGDIFIGSTAPLVAYLLFLQKPYANKLALIWNIAGFGELTLAIILGFFTSPLPYQLLALNNPNNLLFAFPLALIPAFIVPLSLLLHIFSVRVLMRK